MLQTTETKTIKLIFITHTNTIIKMKQIKTLFIAAALFIGATSFATAQTKVAHINTSELIKSMPEMKAACDLI